MNLEVLPARKGDCLIVRLTDDDTERLILIDGGPAGVWGDDLMDRLLELREERAPDGRLFIDLLVVSHVDDDHINGIIRLLESIDADDFPVEIGEIWHNSFDLILGNDQTADGGEGTVLASTAPGAASFVADEDEGLRDAALVLASVAQGNRVRSLAMKLGIPINQVARGGLIMAEEPAISRRLFGAKITFEGPLRADVKALQIEFDKWLRENGAQASTASLLAALEDTSAANLSSLVLSLEASGKRLLLTGDARSDRFLDVMGDGPHVYDIVKMPHHGSDRNVDEAFFREVVGTTYVFSGDGEHGNPERATVAMLLDHRPRGAVPTLVFTYPLATIDAAREVEYEKARRRAARRGVTLPPWDHQTMALEALLVERSGECELLLPDAAGRLPSL